MKNCYNSFILNQKPNLERNFHETLNFSEGKIPVMGKRHVFFGAIFMAVFGIGMLNLLSEGRLGHEINSQFPWHTGNTSAAPEVEVENLSLDQGESEEVVALVRNADEVTYIDYSLFPQAERNNLELEAGTSPSPSFVQQSLPPNWLYDHTEKLIEVRMWFNSSEDTEPGNYTYGIRGLNDDGKKSATANLTVQVLNSSTG